MIGQFQHICPQTTVPTNRGELTQLKSQDATSLPHKSAGYSDKQIDWVILLFCELARKVD